MAHEWFVVGQAGERGPFTAAQLKQLATEGEIDATTLVRRGDLDDPRPARSIKGLLSESHATQRESPQRESPRVATIRNRRQQQQEVGHRQIRNSGRWLLAIGIGMAMVGILQHVALGRVVERSKAELDAEYAASDILEVDGEELTVEEFKGRLDAVVLATSVANFVVSAILVGLSFWARRSPLPALISGLCVYLALVAINAIIDPTTLWHGVLWKVLIIGSLLAGIRAAIAQQAATRFTDPEPA